MYRLHLTGDDLTRIRLAPGMGPFSETALAAESLRNPAPGLAFSRWRRSLRGRLGPHVRLLAHVFPPGGAGLDLPTLAGPTNTFDEGLDRLVGVSLATLRAELEWLGTKYPLTPWAKALPDREPGPRRELAAVLADFYTVAVRPHWPRIERHLKAEHAARTRWMAEGGLDRLLTRLCPSHVRWRPPVLEVQTPLAADADIQLHGRALVLVPSLFVGATPYLNFDLAEDASTVRLVYPTVGDLTAARQLWLPGRHGSDDLAALLGRTRSSVLETVGEGCGTGELARRLGVSAAAVSQHTAVLRANGLIATRRDGATVWHMLTPLGTALLNSNAVPDPAVDLSGGRPHGRTGPDTDAAERALVEKTR
jgi:DNA-binding transcriptional ArsR family regulator